MGLLARLFNRTPPSEEELAQEALRADALIQEARTAQSIMLALPTLKEFKQLVAASPQKDIYDEYADQEVIAEYVMRRAQHILPMLIPIPGDKKPPYEHAINQAITELSEVLNGTMEEQTVRWYALNSGYNADLVTLARIVAERKDDPRLDSEALVNDYAMIRKTAVERLGAVENPCFTNGSSSPVLFANEVVYRDAKKRGIAEIEGSLKKDARNIATDSYDAWFSKRTAQLQELPANVGYEDATLGEQLATLRHQKRTIVEGIQEKIEQEHDDAYEGLRTATTLKDAVEQFGQLLALTYNYQALLGIEDPNVFVEEAVKRFEHLGGLVDYPTEDTVRIRDDKAGYEIRVEMS